MPDTVTPLFFHWMAANNISRKDAANMLDVDERSLSNYRSRGLPKKKQARAMQVMADYEALNISAASVEANRIVVHFNDAEYDLVESAALMTGHTTREFVHKAATERAALEKMNRGNNPALPPLESVPTGKSKRAK